MLFYPGVSPLSDVLVYLIVVQGDVRASAGGGSSVVFTEVETLKQISPGDRYI